MAASRRGWERQAHALYKQGTSGRERTGGPKPVDKEEQPRLTARQLAPLVVVVPAVARRGVLALHVRLAHLEARLRVAFLELLAHLELDREVEAVARVLGEARQLGEQVALRAVVVSQRLAQQCDDAGVARSGERLGARRDDVRARALAPRLAALALLTFVVYLKVSKVGYRFALLPAVVMIVMPMTALAMMVEKFGVTTLLGGTSAGMFVLGLFLMVTSWRRLTGSAGEDLQVEST